MKIMEVRVVLEVHGRAPGSTEAMGAEPTFLISGLAVSWHMGDLGVGEPYVSLGVVAQGGGKMVIGVGSCCRVGVIKFDLKRVFVD